MKTTEQHIPMGLFIMLYKVVLTFESVDGILKCDHSNESYRAVLSCGAVLLIIALFFFYHLCFLRYASLLSQYSAVSFGDPLFGCFVVLPLAQRHDIKFRRAVWDEHVGVLRALSIPLDQVT